MFSDSRNCSPAVVFVWRRPAVLLFLVLLLVVVNALAAEVWDKAPQQWTLADVFQILRDSPWSPSGRRLQTSLERIDRHVDPLTGRPSSAPTDPRDTGWAGRAEIGRSTALPDVSIVWWSSKTVRLAQQRLRQLRGPATGLEPLGAEPLPEIVILVEGTEPQRILREATEDLRETAFLELPGGRMLDVREVRFHESEDAGGDFAAFHFPREMSDRPTIDRNAERAVFHCKAVAKTTKLGRQNALSIRASFEPRKMRVNGHPDF